MCGSSAGRTKIVVQSDARRKTDLEYNANKSKLPVRIRNQSVRGTTQLLIIFTFLCCLWIHTGIAFVVVTNHNRPEGWILFDAQIEITQQQPQYHNQNEHQQQHMDNKNRNNHHHRANGVVGLGGLGAGGSERENGKNDEELSEREMTTINFYTYRISHHKTQPWVHRLFHLDKDGKLRMKQTRFMESGSRRFDSCDNVYKSFPSSFLVYIDIIANPHYVRNNSSRRSASVNANSNDDDSFSCENEMCTYFDFISFPLTIITQPLSSQTNVECDRDLDRVNRVHEATTTTTASSKPRGGNTFNNHNNQNQRSSFGSTHRNDENHDRSHNQYQHLARSVDLIYVSFPVDGHYCLHSSEKLSNIHKFLPASVRFGCQVTASVVSNEHFFAVEASTGDLVLRNDWCLFETAQTVEILLHLKCSPLSISMGSSNGGGGSTGSRHRSSNSNNSHATDRAVMSWDQKVHFIIHRMGGAGLDGQTASGSNSILEFHPIHRMRREMRNQSPFFEQTMYIASVPEEQPPGITVTTISASDPENSPLAYSMTSLLDARSQQFFSLDPKSGIISTVDKLDREKMDVHYFRIVATDSGIPPRTGTATLQINVADQNDESPVFEQSSYSVSIREGISTGSTVLSVRATDQDTGKNGDISYSILNPHDIDDAFRIESDSGVITTKLPLDREQRDEYTLIVQVNDLAPAQVDRKSATATVRVEVLDENDSWPQFTQRSYNVTVPENSDASNYPVIARVSATDADEGVNSALRYSIIGGNSQNHFSIDGLTGEVSLLKSLDYEAGRSYRLNIRAIDSGNPSRSNNTLLLVIVADLNDNVPHFFSPLFQETVQENVPIGSSILRIQAFDPDDGLNSKIYYRISYTENPDLFPFEMESDSGWIKTNKELDREGQSRYDFNVIAADSGEVPLSATASVAILIQDINDNSPVMERKLYETSVSEQDPPGTPVETVKATDPDENSRLTYELVDGNVRNRFSISTQNGVGLITIAQPLDFKLERKFILTIKAVDSGGRFDMATVNIQVNDANTHPPVFQNTPYSVKIFEDVPIDSTVLIVSAVDQDSGQNSQIVYTFVQDGDNEGHEAFMIDSNTGAITTAELLDREKVSGYILTVMARDKGIPPMSDTTDVEIVIMDVNDNSPIFERDFYQAKISEDAPIGTSILQVQAADADSGKNSIVRYSFSTFSDGDGTFSVDAASGIIRTIKALDRETVSRYDLFVLATDQGSPELTGKTNVTITILDVNDNSPHWESDKIRLFIPENSPIGTTVGSIQAYDPDEGSNADIIYSIVGGIDANSFTLNTHQKPSSGHGPGGSADILTRIELDFESPRKKYDIIVRAASPPLRNDVHIEIHVKDTNDNAPRIFPQFQVILNNYKDYFPVGPIGRVPAFDADVTDQLQYEIKTGNKANLVYLNESTGLITLSPYLDTNVPLMAKMDVLVSDGLNEVSSEMILQTRMITDDLLFNSVTVQIADMTTEAFLSPLFTHFLQALAVILNSPKENIVIFSVQEEIEGTHGVLNVSFSARKPSAVHEEYFSPNYIKERVFLNRLTLSKLSTVEVLPFTDDLCLLEPCLNFEECLTVLKFRNVSNFVTTESMLFRSVYPWQTFACRCPHGFTGLKEHYLCDAEINLCFSSPCRNGGTCYRKERGYSCLCPAGYTGPQCEIQLELDTCQPNICSRGSLCTPRVRGGFLCQNCTRGDYVNQLCELTARSFSRGSFLTFPGMKNRYRFDVKLHFASQQRNGLLLYNGRFNERFDFIALEVLNSTVQFSFSLGGNNVTQVSTGKSVSDGLWHSVELSYLNKTAVLSVDDCDVIITLEHPEDFPKDKTCAGKSSQVLEKRCDSLTESCQRFVDLTGPMYIGGLPAPTSSFQIETHDFLGCIKDIYIDNKFLDLNNYVMEYGTAMGCPEKKNYCASQPCKNGGKCLDGWGTYRCQCSDGHGNKDCSEDARPVWNLRDENSFLEFSPQLRPIQFPWYNSLSLRSLHRSGNLMAIKLSNNETIYLTMENGLFTYALEGKVIPVTLPRISDGYWHSIEIKWMTAEIWFSLDFGQHEITIPWEAKVQGLFVSQVVVGGQGDSFTGCIQDVRVGSSKNYHRKTSAEKFVNEGCSLATACVGAVCPPRSTCMEQAGRHKCQCDAGYVGAHCTPICDLKPCKNNGTCILDLTTSRGYKCKCDDRYFRGNNCEEIMDLTCPSTWWGWPLCGPCSCPADKNFSPECNKKTGQCKCREYHYEKENACIDCMCYSVGSVSKNCDLMTGKCQCRTGVVGNRCDTCSNPFAEVTLRGCEVVYDGCPRAFHSDIWWPRTKFVTVAVHDCPARAIGLATRECANPEGWKTPDLFNCTSTSFISLLNIVSQLDAGELTLSPLLSTKLAADLFKALNGSSQLYGNDLWLSLRLLKSLIRHETQQKGLNLSHRQDKNFIKNLVRATGKVTSKEYGKEWQRVASIHGSGADSLMSQMDKYLAHLVLNQEDTFTKPFEIITPNLVLGLDTIELTWDNEDKKNYENFAIQSSYDLYETNTVIKRAIRFPKYDNIIMDPRRYSSKTKIIIPLDILGLNDEKDMAGNAVVGYMEYYSLWEVLPKLFQNDVNRRFNSELVAHPPIITLSILASRLGLQTGRQTSPIRLTYEIYGKYIDSTNPQCVLWEDPSVSTYPLGGSSGQGGWTTRPCITQVEEAYVSKMGNVMTVNCTCWHLSTYALLIENNEINDVPRPGLLEDIITYVAFTLALLLIFGALIALGLLKGPVPATITNTIHKHLLLCIFCSLVFYMVGLKLRLFLVQNDIMCRSVAIGLHFFWLSTFAWLFSSSLHLRRMFTEVRDVNHGSSLSYFALGYAFPLLCVALSLGVRAHHYGNKFFCWLSLYEGIVWGMVGPILLAVICTLVTFLIAVRAAFTLKDNVVDSGNMRTLLWMDLTLLPICGSVWALSLLGANERGAVWQYAISASVTFLSLYIALGYCILNQRVKESLYLRAGSLFRARDEMQPSNISRSALAYRSNQRLQNDDLRREMFLGPRSVGISTASTTSRSTTKTSSSPYRSDGFHTYGGTPNIDGGRFVKGNNDTVDSVRKTYTKRGRKRSNSDQEGSSDGEHTLELASSHSSDEDEASGSGRHATLAVNGHGNYRLVKGLITPSPTRKHVSASLSTLNVPSVKLPALPRLYSTNWTPNISTTCSTYRDFANNVRPGMGGRSSGNSGSDNESPIINMSSAVAAPQEYGVSHKVLNSSENLHLGQGPELKYGNKIPYMYQEAVNDLSGSIGMLPPQMSPPNGHSTPHPYHFSLGRPTDSPISPVQEHLDEIGASEHEMREEVRRSRGRGLDNPGLMSDGDTVSGRHAGEAETDIYGGSITSGVLV